jgi:putative acetyltransferase
MPPLIRPESPADAPAIHAVTEAAFRTAPHSAGTEQFIVDALRRAGSLAVSLVAEFDGKVIGHVAVSPVTVSDGASGCMLAGDPAYYRRFGFEPVTDLNYPGVPAEYFMAVSFGPPLPRGVATFHDGFAATA